MRFLPNLLGDKDPLGSARRSLAQWSAGWSFPYQPRWLMQRAVKDGFERSLWVYRCIDSIATDFASLPVLFREGNRDSGEIIENPASHEDRRLLHLLNVRPNPFQTARPFKYLIGVQFLLSRSGVFIEVQRDSQGRVNSLYVLPPDKMKPIPDPVMFVSGFELTHGSGGIETLKPENVLWLRKPHPLDPYEGTTPTEAAGINIDTDFFMAMFARNFALNDGRPSAVVGVKGKMSKTDSAELQDRFTGGPKNAGKVSVVESDRVSIADLSTTPREAQFVDGRQASKEDLLTAFGVPESVLGNASGRTWDNAEAEENVYWRKTIKPNTEWLLEPFDTLTKGGRADNMLLAPDLSGVYSLTRDEREKESRHQAEFAAGLITADEYRELTGKEPFNVPASKVLWLPSGKMPIGAKADQEASVELVNSISPAPEGAEGIEGEGGGGQPGVPKPGKTLPPPEPRRSEGKALSLWDGEGRWQGPPVEVLSVETKQSAQAREALQSRVRRSKELGTPSLGQATTLSEGKSLDGDNRRARMHAAGQLLRLDDDVIESAIEARPASEDVAFIDSGGHADSPESFRVLLERVADGHA